MENEKRPAPPRATEPPPPSDTLPENAAKNLRDAERSAGTTRAMREVEDRMRGVPPEEEAEDRPS